mgnify:CR=1 FL=1
MKLCNIYNSAAHYRRGIFLRMDEEFDCAWAFGRKPIGGKDIKSMEPREFRNFLGYLQNVRLFGNWYWQSGALKLLFRDFDTYIVLGEPFCVSTWLFCALAKLMPKKRVFFWTHGWYGRENFAKRVLKKIFFRLGNGVFLYGNYARELMIKEGFSPEKLWTLHNSLAYDEQRALRERLTPSPIFRTRFGNENKTLIFVGRLTPTKRLDMILDAAAILRSRGAAAPNVVFVGDGAARASLEAKTRELNLEKNVCFYGACYDEAKLAELIFNADLCVSPGNIGLTAIHALSFGCPCITHDDFRNQMPEFEAIVPGKTGAFFERGNADSLASAIEKWFSENRSRDEIRRACFAEIDASWNPQFQINVLKKGLGAK